jgi:HK97 family phage major capsid protein
MKLQELQASRHDAFLAAEKVVGDAKRSGVDLAGSQLTEYNRQLQTVKDLDARIAECQKNSGDPQARNPGSMYGREVITESGWTDPRTGQPVAVLKPEQRMADLAGSAAYDAEPLSLGKYVRGLATGRWDGAEREMRAMTEGSLGGGGYLVPSPLSSQIIDRVRNAAVTVRAGARTIPMDSSTLSIARVAASNGDPTAAWHAENAAITASDMAFEQVKFTAQTLASIVSMSVELFEDATGLDVLVADTLGKVLGLELDRACLRGSGTQPEPKGIRNQSGVTVDSTTFTTNGSVIGAAAPTGAVAWDWVSKQVSALWGANENPNAVIYSARTAGELDLLRASTGAVLPPPGSVANLQRLFTNSVPNTLTQGTSNDCSEAYVGDFSQSLIGLRREVVLEVSRTANVGATSMFSTMGIALRAYLRADFQLARPAAFRVVTGIR